MEKLLMILIVIVLTAGCDLLSGDRETEQISEEQKDIQAGNAMDQRDLENKKLRNALIFLQNKDKYTEEELTAVGIPQINMAHALKCMMDCKGNILQYMGLGGCSVSSDALDEIAANIRQLACVPLGVNIPNDKKRQQFLGGIDDYEPGQSHVVVCYKEKGELVFHIKNREIVEVF
jgi:hypothetical protein